MKVNSTKKYFAYVAFCLAVINSTFLFSQANKNVKWDIQTPSVKGALGETVVIKIHADIVKKSHVYSLKKYPDSLLGPQSTVLTLADTNKYSIGEVKSPKPIAHKDPNFDNLETEYWENKIDLEVPLIISKNAKLGTTQDSIIVTFMSCDDKSCMPPTDVVLTFNAEITGNPQSSNNAASGASTNDNVKKKEEAELNQQNSQSTGVEQFDNARKEGFWSFILVCMAAGFASIFLPCVYPIIPITISFFSKRNHATRQHAIRDVSFYALGIILTFTLVGVFVAVVFGASKLNEFVANPIVNLFIAVIFLVLAFSLFGAYELQLPSFIVDKLNKSANQNKNSVSGVLLMGVVFALTSFSCTGAVIASLLSIAASGDWTWALAGMTAFAVVFSLPFVVFGFFPTLLKQIPSSGGWMNSIKVVFGFVEIAAAIKFLSSADLVWETGLLTREVVLALWIAIFVMTALYLIGIYRFSHDSVVEKIGIPKAMFAIFFLFISIYMAPGLLGAKLGEIDAILPPQIYPGKGNTSFLAGFGKSGGEPHKTLTDPLLENVKTEEDWIVDNLDAGLKLAHKEKKNVFIDFTGYQCTNCRWMEQNMFPVQNIKSKMDKFVKVRLYTDRRDSINIANRTMENDRFGTIAMPYYAIVNPENAVLSTFPGLTRDEKEFDEFLSKGL